ncbi:MAG: glutaminase [Bacteroidota bacterium]
MLEKVYTQIKAEPNLGEVADYIPELGKVSPDKFGISLITPQEKYYAIGDAEESFSIQSIVKVLTLCLAYRQLGGELWERVNVEPSGTPFNSLVQLEYEEGIPRNPFINAGAIVVCDVLMDLLPSPKADFIAFVRELSDNPDLNYNAAVIESEKSEGYRNFALVNFLRAYGNIRNEVKEVLDFYFSCCSISMNCHELAHTFLFLANHGQTPSNGEKVLTPSRTKRINAIMQTYGFYDEAGEFAYRVGLHGKSGVGGGIIAIHPERFSIAVWSPSLNKKGNSYRGMRFLECFTTFTESSVF